MNIQSTVTSNVIYELLIVYLEAGIVVNKLVPVHLLPVLPTLDQKLVFCLLVNKITFHASDQ